MWQKSKDFAIRIYKLTTNFPRIEQYGLTAQLRRASVSMASNIAERFFRRSKPDKLHFLRMAYGSGAEIETQLIIAEEIGYIDDKNIFEELREIMKILNAVINKL